jgi:PNKP adenylyltransferase domain, C-terminal region/PNKP adenylyltransferase domain, ligase domain
MVVKPIEFGTKDRRDLTQPAVKVRGREYLRIIYGSEFTIPENLERLKSRGLGAKRSLALREFALGVEAMERFAHREPLRRVHECVLGYSRRKVNCGPEAVTLPVSAQRRTDPVDALGRNKLDGFTFCDVTGQPQKENGGERRIENVFGEFLIRIAIRSSRLCLGKRLLFRRGTDQAW